MASPSVSILISYSAPGAKGSFVVGPSGFTAKDGCTFLDHPQGRHQLRLLSSRSLRRDEIRDEVIERGWFETVAKARHRRSSVVGRELRQFFLEEGVQCSASIAELNRERVFVDADPDHAPALARNGQHLLEPSRHVALRIDDRPAKVRR